jgi:GNAT superfamily N-acetyltransferase
MRRQRPPKATSLTNKVWAAADLGEVRVGAVTVEVARTLDEAWSPRRAGDDIHLAWVWANIVPDLREAFVVRAKGEPIAIWGSKLGSPIELGGQKYYRLDYLEVDPDRRGDGQTSALLLGLIAKRAAEHGATGVVLATFNIDGLIRAYEYLGAERGAPSGWNHPIQLVPLTYKQPALTRLRELIDDLEEDPPGPLP